MCIETCGVALVLKFFFCHKEKRICFLYGFKNWFISAVLEPAFSHTEKSCIEMYHRQFSACNEIKKS